MKKFILFIFCLTSYLYAIEIVIPNDFTKIEKTAAEELKLHLDLIGIENNKIISENQNNSKSAIFVGNTNFAQKLNIKCSDLKPEQWIIKSSNNNLILAGGNQRGVLYAAFEYLERFNEVIWLDEWTTYTPKKTTLHAFENIDISGCPSFAVRSMYNYFPPNISNLKDTFNIHNRQNHFHDATSVNITRKKFGIDLIYGSPRSCHTYYNYTKGVTDPNIYSYSMGQNKRLIATSGRGPGQICYSNANTRKLFLKRLKEFIKLDRSRGYKPTIYAIMENDNGNKCECANCRAKAKELNSYSALVVDFLNELAREIRKDYPEIKILGCAYMYNSIAPKNIKIEDNVIMQIAQLGGEFSGHSRDTMRSLTHKNNIEFATRIKNWSKISKIGMWDYWVLYAGRGQYPAIYLRDLQKNLQFYHNNNVFLMFAECEWEYTTSFHALRVWLGYQLMNDVNLDFDKKINDFMTGYYGKAAPFMKQYMNYLQKRNDEVLSSLSDVPLNKRNDLDNDFFETSENLLTQAENAESNNQEILNRIGRERISIDWARLDKRKYLDENLKPNIQEVAKRLLKNYTWCLNKYTSKSRKSEEKIAEMQLFCKSIFAKVPPLQGFEDRKVLADYSWPKLCANRFRATIISDPEAAGGKAIAIVGKENNSTDSIKSQENRGVKMGVYSFENRIHLGQMFIPKEKIKTDEKYHFYSLGNLKLSEKCFLWMHWSWYMQLHLSELYDYTDPSGKSNNVEVFVSLKMQGPNYVKNSNKSNMYAIDRVVVCQAKPITYKDREVIVDLKDNKLLGLRYRSKVINDYGLNVIGMDGTGGRNAKEKARYASNEGIKIGIYDLNNKRNKNLILISENKIPKDEKYHIYKISNLKITKNSLLWLHWSWMMQINLNKIPEIVEEQNVDVFISLKLQGKQFVEGSKKTNLYAINRIVICRTKK